jgi:hypothetical protein
MPCPVTGGDGIAIGVIVVLPIGLCLFCAIKRTGKVASAG